MAAFGTSEVSTGDDYDDVFDDFMRERSLGRWTDKLSDIEVSDYHQCWSRDLSDAEQFRESESEGDELWEYDWSDTDNDLFWLNITF